MNETDPIPLNEWPDITCPGGAVISWADSQCYRNVSSPADAEISSRTAVFQRDVRNTLGNPDLTAEQIAETIAELATLFAEDVQAIKDKALADIAANCCGS